MSTLQYERKIRDFHDFDMAFKEAEKISRKNSDAVKQSIETLVRTSYSDITHSEKEQDKKSTEQLDRIFDKNVQNILSNNVGISQAFDKAKRVLETEIASGNIDGKYREQIIKDISVKIRKMISGGRNDNSPKNSEEGIQYTVKLGEKNFNVIERMVLGNEKLVSKMSQNIRKTIRGQNKVQSKNIINLLTNNKYKELSFKIRKDNVTRVKTLVDSGMIRGVNGTSKEKSFIGRVRNKFTNSKTILRLFNVKRDKLNKRGFIGLYNREVYKQLISRIGEFDESIGLTKGKLGKTLLKNVLKWGTGTIITGITKILGFGWKLMKSVFNQILSITKSVGRMGISILSKVKNFILNPVGIWVIGFFSGMLYQAVIEPIVNKLKEWLGFILKPLKKWLGFDEEADVSINELKNKLGLKFKSEVEDAIKERKASKTIENLKTLEYTISKAQDILGEIDMFMNGGGWERATRKTVAGSSGVLGTMIGMAIGSIFPGAGTMIGGVIGGVIGGIAGSCLKNLPDKKDQGERATRNKYLTKIRQYWQQQGLNKHYDKETIARYNQVTSKRNIAKKKHDDIKEEMRKNDEMLSLDPNNVKFREKNDELQKQLESAKVELDMAQKEVEALGLEYDDFTIERITEMQDKIWQSDGVYYFDMNDFGSLRQFFDDAMNGKFSKHTVDEDKDKNKNIDEYRQIEIGQIKKQAMMEATNRYLEGMIPFDAICNYADLYMEEMKSRPRVQFHREGLNQPDAYTSRDKKTGVHLEESQPLDEKISETFEKLKGKLESDWKEQSKTYGLNEQWDQVGQRRMFGSYLIEAILNKNMKTDEERNQYVLGKMKQFTKKQLEAIKYDQLKRKKGVKQNPEEESELIKGVRNAIEAVYQGKIQMAKKLSYDITDEWVSESMNKIHKGVFGTSDSDVKKELGEIEQLKKIKDTKKTTKEDAQKKLDKANDKLDEIIRDLVSRGNDEILVKQGTEIDESIKPERIIVPVLVDQMGNPTDANDEPYKHSYYRGNVRTNYLPSKEEMDAVFSDIDINAL